MNTPTKQRRRHEIYEATKPCKNHKGCALYGECADPPCEITVVDMIEYVPKENWEDFEKQRLANYVRQTGRFANGRSRPI
jgi:hypothetical protein